CVMADSKADASSPPSCPQPSSSLLLRRPPRASLLPYTTLFRSSDRDAVVQAIAHTGGVITSAAAVMVTLFALLMLSHVELIKALDRKSTRLNSSHVKISYAVFCLKKKM